MLSGIIILLFTTGTGYCQLTGLAKRELGMSGYLSIGINMVKSDALNDNLNTNGYSSFGELFGTWGGGMHLILRKKIVIGMSYNKMREKNESDSDYRSSIDGSSRSIEVGYVVYSKNMLQVFPFVGFGSQSINLTIYETGEASFDDIISNPSRGSSLSRMGFMLDIGVQMNSFTMVKNRKSYLLGFRSGYRFVPGYRGWRIDGSTVSGGPESGLNGLYVNLNIGVPALMKKILWH